MTNAWVVEAVLVALKASVVLTCALGVTLLMRRRPAAERHLVWVIASVCVLALPLLSALSPSWRVSLRLPGWLERDLVQVSPAPAVVAAPRAEATVSPAPRARAEGRGSASAVAIPGVAPAAPPSASARVIPPVAPAARAVPAVPAGASGAPLAVLILCVWAAGALLVAAHVVVGLVRVQLLAARTRPLRAGALLERGRGLAAQLGVTRRLRLLEGARDAMPISFGVVRPSLLLPSSAVSWPVRRQEAVLRHELAHIRRRDSLTQLLAEIGCVLYWFNPLMWWAARRLCVEREYACDDAVVMSGSRPSEYAAELLDIARTLRVPRLTGMAAIAMARRSDLRTRLTALLDERRRSDRASVRLLVPAWLGALIVLTPLSSLVFELTGRMAPDAMQVQVSPMAPKHETQRSPNRSAGAPALAAPGFSVALPPVSSFATGAAGALPEQDDCLSQGRNRSINSNDNDDRRTIKWSSSDCSGEVVVEGDVRFNDDYTSIVGVSRDGFVRITTEEGRTERRVLIRPSDNAVSYEYRVNGDRREFDSAGQAWLSNTLVFLFRRIGFMAEERATAMLERGGTNALLTEVGLLQGDHTRSTYLRVLIDRGRLDEASLRRVLELAGSTIRSDHYRTNIVTAVAGRYELTDGVRDAYIRALAELDSDHYRHVGFSTLLEKGRLTPTQVSAVLGEIRRIDSDHYRTALLKELGSTYASSPEIRNAYLEAAAGISSDHYKASILLDLLRRRGLSSTDLARVVQASATISSDHYRASVLNEVSTAGLRDPALQRAFVEAARGISSDHHLHRVLSVLAEREELDRATLLLVLDVAGNIDSDHYRSQLLVGIAQKHRIDGEVRERFMKAMNGIGSEHYRGRVASALLRQTG